MEKFFKPNSIVIFGLSAKENNIPGYILQNTLRWGYKGKLFGVTPEHSGEVVHGIPVYNSLEELPIVPELAVMLIPAKFIPMAMESCGEFGVKRAAVLAGGFNETGDAGGELANQVKEIADRYGIRFMGPNGLTVSDAHSGVCLPFIPHKKMKKGSFSLITQSGGLCLVLWNLMSDENVGMAKFASIGNKLNIDEADVLEYYGRDPETKVIGLYLESIANGEKLIEVAMKIDKPIIALKSNTSEAGLRTAMSHTASMSNNDSIVDAAFEKAGIIRIEHVHDFISTAKIFSLPPMKGNRLMVMTPGGGSAVMMADVCEKYDFEFADPGEEFYESLNEYTNAGVIKFSNPLDMGDIYNIQAYPNIFKKALSNENVDGAIYGHAIPLFPGDDNSIFKKMFYTDISKETIGAMLSANKPLGVTMFAPAEKLVKINRRLDYPIYTRAEELIKALRVQVDFYMRKSERDEVMMPSNVDISSAKFWLEKRDGDTGEEMLEVLSFLDVRKAESHIAENENEAVIYADEIGYPVVLKIVSPDILHKSDAGGVITEIKDENELREAFCKIKTNILQHNSVADIQGIRVMEMAEDGHDMFIGAMRDDSFGPVVVFGYGGIYTEIFKDVERVLCPSSKSEIREKLERLKCFEILKGARGKAEADIDALVDFITKISYLMSQCSEIKELDFNPVRVFENGKGVMALDARARIDLKNNHLKEKSLQYSTA